MKSLFKIRIHPLFYLVLLIVVFTGYFKYYSYIMIIIIVHEVGHIIMSKMFKWHIDKVIILPFGGLTIFNEKINRPLKEELLIAISGPLLQIIVFSFITNDLIRNYHYALLLFNLLPIFPLDGSKILNCLMNYWLPFKFSYYITLNLSLVLLFIISLYKFNLVTLIILLFLFFKTIDEFYSINSIFNKFLMERYLYKFNFKKISTINGYKLSLMRRDKKHVFKINNNYYSERDLLKKRFDM